MTWSAINQSFDIGHIYIHYVVLMLDLNSRLSDDLKHKIVSLEYFRTKNVSTAYAIEPMWIAHKRRHDLEYPLLTS